MADRLSVQDRIERATGLEAILQSAHEAFEAMLSVIGSYQDGGSKFFAALEMAAAAAADGRDAVAAAPSLPAGYAGDWRPEAASARAIWEGENVARELADLSSVVAARLEHAVPFALQAEDRAACWSGAEHAREAHAFLARKRQ